ncbi:MAG TPA: hypothetical protein VGA37_05385 [Gemmatimonadales bacterium]
MGTNLPPGIQAIYAELAGRRFESLDEANAFLRRRMDEYNATPQAELGGFSPVQLHGLFGGDWKTHGAPRLEAQPAEALAGAAFVHNGQLLLRAASVKAGLKATATGNLARAVVSDMVDRMTWPQLTREDFWHRSKVLNETDVWPLHIVRLVLGLAKLLRRRKGAFHASQLGRRLALDPAAGLLHADLFRTFFRQLNLAYLAPGGLDEGEPFQGRAALVFLRLVATDEAWRSAEAWEAALAHDVPPPPMIGGVRWSQFERRWLEPLEWFGLLEGRDVPGKFPPHPDREYRRTSLATAFLRFPASLVAAAGVERDA